MLTKREEQILAFIQEQPEITQAELAVRCGITRSSVAVHVSNLMKKGVITGRGYIVRSEPYILVVGGQNIDICGHPAVEPSPHESTPGRIHFSEGGVGRNITANLALMGEEVKFITVFGSDSLAERLAVSARRLGVDTSQSLSVNGATSTYLFISTTKGDVNLSISDTGLFDHLTPEILARRQKVIQGAGLCIADTNLPEDTLQWLAENCPCPLFLSTISRHKAPRAGGVIPRLHTLAINAAEAELMSGIPLTDEDSMWHICSFFLQQGAGRVFLMRGRDGVYATDGTESVIIGGTPVQAVNALGTSDSFVAVLALAMRRGFSLEQSARAGAAAAAICMRVRESVNARLSAELLLKEMTKVPPVRHITGVPLWHTQTKKVPFLKKGNGTRQKEG